MKIVIKLTVKEEDPFSVELSSERFSTCDQMGMCRAVHQLEAELELALENHYGVNFEDYQKRIVEGNRRARAAQERRDKRAQEESSQAV